MTTQFPTTLDTFSNPTATSKLSDTGILHSDQHANANDAIEALEAKVGVTNSTDANSLDYKTKYLKARIEGWNNIVTPVTVSANAQSPIFSNIREGVYGYAFAPDLLKECFTNFNMGHDYVPGTMVYPHIHWTSNTLSTGTIRWGVEFTWARRDDSGSGQMSFPVTQTIYIEHTAEGGEYIHHVNESLEGNGISGVALDGSFLEVDSIIMCRFFRDAEHLNDTYPDPVFLLSLDIHYQSNTKSTPLRFPPFR